MHAEGKDFSFVNDELPLYAQKYGGDIAERNLCNIFLT